MMMTNYLRIQFAYLVQRNNDFGVRIFYSLFCGYNIHMKVLYILVY